MPAVLQEARSIFVQWRDVAGNWSAPITVGVWYAPEGSVMPEPTPSPSPTAQPSAPTPSAPAASASMAPLASVAPAASVVPGSSGLVEGAVSR